MFKETKEGQTHYQDDGCGEPAHNKMTKPKKQKCCEKCLVAIFMNTGERVCRNKLCPCHSRPKKEICGFIIQSTIMGDITCADTMPCKRHPRPAKEMYKCPSYYDDSNILQDCSCGKCSSLKENEEHLEKELIKEMIKPPKDTTKEECAYCRDNCIIKCECLDCNGKPPKPDEWEKEFLKRFPNDTYDIPYLECKSFVKTLLASQKSEWVREAQELIRLRMIKEADTPLTERKSGWDILIEVRDDILEEYLKKLK